MIAMILANTGSAFPFDAGWVRPSANAKILTVLQGIDRAFLKAEVK